jgi:hypothetical protein
MSLTVVRVRGPGATRKSRGVKSFSERAYSRFCSTRRQGGVDIAMIWGQAICGLSRCVQKVHRRLMTDPCQSTMKMYQSLRMHFPICGITPMLH